MYTLRLSDVLPRDVGEHVLAAEAVDPGLRRHERAAVLVEHVVPRVEQHVAPDVDDRQVSVGLVHDRLEAAEPRRQERLEHSPVQPGPLRLPVARIVRALRAVHVARVRFVERRYPQLCAERRRGRPATVALTQAVSSMGER